MPTGAGEAHPAPLGKRRAMARTAAARLRDVIALAAAGLVFAVAPAWAGTISGTVTDAATAGAPNDYICVLALNGAGDAAGSTATDPAGRYALSGLAAGAYRVEFVDDGGCLSQAGTYAFQYYPRVAAPSQATPVTVGAGAVTGGIDAALQPGGGIAGRVAAAGGGQPLAGVCARLLDPRGDFVLQQPTDRSGAYDLEQLPAGRYKVEFVDDGCTGQTPAYAAEYFDTRATLAQADPITVRAGQTMPGIDGHLALLGGGAGGGGGAGTGGGGSGPGAGRGGGSGVPPPSRLVLARLRVSRAGVAVDRRGRFSLTLRCAAAHTCRVTIAVRIARRRGRGGSSPGTLIATTRSGSPIRIRPHRRRSIQLRLLAAGRRLIRAGAPHRRLHVYVLLTVVAGSERSRSTSRVLTMRMRSRR
jgi:hypothetical protein